jgi:hypothetical protein
MCISCWEKPTWSTWKRNPVMVDFDGRSYRVSTVWIWNSSNTCSNAWTGSIPAISASLPWIPDTGRLLTMAGFNKIDPDRDPCLMAEYPAASLFKIVTAAAAVEEKGYTAGSRFKFNGYKHTLYKRQLTIKPTATPIPSLCVIPLPSPSIRCSENRCPFLKPDALEAYGDAFAFNQAVGFELPWPTSRLAVKDDAYHRAEIASGFNRQTTLSPLHGAVIVSAVVNGGIPVEPTLVDRIIDECRQRLCIGPNPGSCRRQCPPKPPMY